MTFAKRSLAVFVSLLLVWTMAPAGADAISAPALPARQEVYAPVPPKDMDALVAPIALYPDSLIAQILGACTYPDQVEAANAFVKDNPDLTGTALAEAGDPDWDPSVGALLQFPSVLDKLAQNLGWTSALGDVSANQQEDVMAAIQRMRAKAYEAGNLKSGEQIKVVKESPDVIVIQPANPQVVYVPTYNPTVIYGAPVVTPGYSAGAMAATAVISFGVGIAVGAMVSSSSCGWGYSGWRMNWAGGMVYCGGARYYGNPYWWGGYYPGFRPGYRPPYYPPPRPPRPPPVGWRPPPPGTRPPYRPPGGKPPLKPPPPNNGRPPVGGRPPGNVKPTPLPTPGRPNPDRPTIQPVPDRPANQPVKPGPGKPGPGNPGRPSIQPVPGGQGKPTTRPSTPGQGGTPRPTRELRGYPNQQNTRPAPKPNAFSGSGGGRPESARGNRSLNPPPKSPNTAAPTKGQAPGNTKR